MTNTIIKIKHLVGGQSVYSFYELIRDYHGRGHGDRQAGRQAWRYNSSSYNSSAELPFGPKAEGREVKGVQAWAFVTSKPS